MIASPSLIALTIGLFSFTSNAQELSAINRGELDFVPIQVWEEALANANATSDSINARGYDITETYPGSEVDGYTLSLTLVGNYPMSENTYMTGAQISYQAPRALQNRTSHRTWAHCPTVYLIEDYDLEEDVNPGCEGIVSDDCYEALREIRDSGEECLTVYLPDECADDIVDLNAGWYGSLPAGASDVELGLTMHDPDDFEAYDRLARGVFLTQIGFVDDEANYPGERTEGERIPGVLSCLRVEIGDGSRTPEEGKAANVGMAWGFFALSLIVSLGLL